MSVNDGLDPQKAKQRRLALALRQNLAKRKTRVKAVNNTADDNNASLTKLQIFAGDVKSET